jgi:UDP-glucose 4-epimerase
MRILVTGGAGFIGSHVVDALVAAGHHVAVVDNLSSGKRENLHPEARLYKVDIRDAERLAQVFAQERPEVVDHHAAQIDVGRSVAEPGFDAEVNVLGTLNVLEAARQAGTRGFITISSAAVYGEPRYLPVDEDHPRAPLSPYGASKTATEIYLGVYGATHGLATAALRYANVYGPRQDPHGEAGVVAIFTERMLAADPARPPMIHGDGAQTRDFIYVGDCARANLAAIAALALDKGGGAIYNIGTGAETSVAQLAQALKAATGYAGEIARGPARPGDIVRMVSDCSRAREALGFEATTSLAAGLAATVAYFRA